MFPRRNKAHRYALPSRGHQWWWWWWWYRTRGEEDVAWPGSKWKLLKPLSPRANERSLSRLPGWDPGRKCQRSTAPNRSIYTKNLPSSRYLAPIPINCVARRIAFSSSFDILRAPFLFLFYFFIFFFFLSFTSFTTRSLSLSLFSKQRIVSFRNYSGLRFFLIGIWVFSVIRGIKLILYIVVIKSNP